MNFFHLGRGNGFTIKLLAAKVWFFFFTLSYFIEKIIKKDMIGFVHENHDKRLSVTPVQHFCSGFHHANLVSSFRGTKY